MNNVNIDDYKGYLQTYIDDPATFDVNLEVPGILGNSQLASFGILDVTASPFNADNFGIKDATKSIQEAVNFARDKQMVCYFPAGTYSISDTISCIQKVFLSKEGVIAGARTFPCVLIGSREDRNKRSKIVLKSNSPEFGNDQVLKPVIHFWARSFAGDPHKSQPNICYNQLFANLDIEVEEGNSGAVCLDFQGAQGAGAMDCIINAGDAHTGLRGCVGSGGCHSAITIINGRIGLDFQKTNPVPTIVGFQLIRQKEVAILFSGSQSLSAAGLKIEALGSGPVVKAFGSSDQAIGVGSPPKPLTIST